MGCGRGRGRVVRPSPGAHQRRTSLACVLVATCEHAYAPHGPTVIVPRSVSFHARPPGPSPASHPTCYSTQGAATPWCRASIAAVCAPARLHVSRFPLPFSPRHPFTLYHYHYTTMSIEQQSVQQPHTPDGRGSPRLSYAETSTPRPGRAGNGLAFGYFYCFILDHQVADYVCLPTA